MREKIIEKYDNIPKKQIATGVFIKTIGIKYITLIDCWNAISIRQILIEDFYKEHIGFR